MMKILASVAVLFVLALPNASAGSIQLGTGTANWKYNDPYMTNYSLPTIGPASIVTPTDADWYGGWIANSSSSSWVAPNPNVTNNGPAPYTFNLAFNLTGYNLSTVAFTGAAWTIDDAGILSLNGCGLSSVGDGGWGSLHTFSLGDCTFNQGANMLTATMTFDDQFLEGIDLQGSITGTQSSATPEPSSLILFGTSLLGLVPFRRKLIGR